MKIIELCKDENERRQHINYIRKLSKELDLPEKKIIELYVEELKLLGISPKVNYPFFICTAQMGCYH